MGRVGDLSTLVQGVVPNAEVVPQARGYALMKSGYLRAYGHLSVLEKAADEGRLIVAGYASPQVLDREKHVITKEALANDLPRFMANPDYRNANLLHSNVQVGKVIPYWVDPDTGKRYETKVDHVGLFCVVEIRTDPARPKICDKVAEDIRSGKLAAFSISADAPYDSRRHECSSGTCFWVIDAVELYEVTICETPVNQDAKFTVLSKSFDTSEWEPYTWCQDGSCTVVSKAGITEFSTKRELGTFDRATPHAADIARGERLNDNPQAPLDLTQDQHGETPHNDDPNLPDDFDFDDVFDQTDTAGNYGTLGIGKALGNVPNTLDDETQYLNFDEPAPWMPDEHDPERNAPSLGTGPYMNLTDEGAEFFHLGLKADLGQLSPEEAVQWGKISKDNEASGFPPDAASGQLILGTDHPTPPKLQGKPKQPKLQQPVTGTPSIMRALDEALTDAAKLDLSESQAALVHRMRLAIVRGELPCDWDTSPRILKHTGAWVVKGGLLPVRMLLTSLRKAAVVQGERDAILRLGLARTLVESTPPLTTAQAADIVGSLVLRAQDAGIYGSVLYKAADGLNPKRDLAGIMALVGRITRDPDARGQIQPRILGALDTIHDEAQHALEGLDLGLTIGLSDDSKLPPDDPKVQYRHAENPTQRCGVCRHYRDDGSCELVGGAIQSNMTCDLFSGNQPEHDIIRNADAHATLNDVRKTDRLLEAVSKAALPPQKSQDEAEAAQKSEQPDHTDGAMIAWFPTSGTARQFAHEGGESADQLHVTVVYLGKAADLTPEHVANIRKILTQHCLVQPPIEGEITGITHFAPSKSSDGRRPMVASIAADDLHAFRRRLVQALDAAGVPYDKTFKHYVPHMTLKYDLPGMDDLQERGIPEIESTPIEIDRLHLVIGGQREEYTLDEGQTQIDGKDPQGYARKVLKSGDEDALTYGGLFERMWRRGFPDPSYRLVLQKGDGEILPFDQ